MWGAVAWAVAVLNYAIQPQPYSLSAAIGDQLPTSLCAEGQVDRPPRLSWELPGTQMRLLAFSSHTPLPALPADLCDSRHCAHCSPSAGHQSQGILGASCWGQLTLLWTALSWFPLPTLTLLKLLISQASTVMVSLCPSPTLPAAGPPSASLTHSVARSTGDVS